MKNFRITKRDLTFLAIGSIAVMIIACFFNRKDNSASGKNPDVGSSKTH